VRQYSIKLSLCACLASGLLIGDGNSQNSEAILTVNRLIKAARIYDKEEMSAASMALSKIGKPAIPALIRAMDDFDDNVRWQAVVAMGRIGFPGSKAAITVIVKALGDIDPDVRGASAVALGIFKQKSRRILNALKKNLGDEHGMVRADAHWAMWELVRDPGAVPALISLLNNKDWMVSHAAAHHLGEIGEPAVVPLIKHLTSKTSKGRHLAAEALGRIGPVAAPGTPALIAALTDENKLVVEASIRSLGQVGNAVINPLLAFLKTAEVDARKGVIRALGELGSEAVSAVPDLVIHLKTDKALQEPCIRSLGLIGPKAAAAVEELKIFLGHADPDCRGSAAQALGRIGKPAEGCLPKLREMAKKDDADFVRAAARHAVGLISGN
jgi:HEAT repeat protein